MGYLKLFSYEELNYREKMVEYIFTTTLPGWIMLCWHCLMSEGCAWWMGNPILVSSFILRSLGWSPWTAQDFPVFFDWAGPALWLGRGYVSGLRRNLIRTWPVSPNFPFDILIAFFRIFYWHMVWLREECMRRFAHRDHHSMPVYGIDMGNFLRIVLLTFIIVGTFSPYIERWVCMG